MGNSTPSCPFTGSSAEGMIEELASSLASLSEALANCQQGAQEDLQRRQAAVAVPDTVYTIEMEVEQPSMKVLDMDALTLTQAEMVMQRLASSLEGLFGQLAHSQCQLEEERNAVRSAVESAEKLAPSQSDLAAELTLDRQTLVEMVTDMQEGVLHEQGAVSIPSNGHDFVCWYTECIKKLRQQKSNQVILTLFWQLMKECSQVNRTSESAFGPEEAFKCIDKTNSGKVPRADFKNFAAPACMPLDTDTMSHIYDLVASDVDGLTQADFVRIFGSFVLKDGLELLAPEAGMTPTASITIPLQTPNPEASAAVTPGGSIRGNKAKPKPPGTPVGTKAAPKTISAKSGTIKGTVAVVKAATLLRKSIK